MLQYYQFSFKKVNVPHFYFYYLISIFFIKFCLCTTYDNVHLTDFGAKKTVSIDPEEIIRRRSVAESYLKEESEAKNDWIETYHEIFSESSVSTPIKTKQENSLENEHEIHVSLPFQNVDLSSLKISEDSIRLYESSFNGINSGKNSEDETMSSKKSTHDTLQKSVKIDNENQDSLESDNLKSKNLGKSQINSKLKSNKLRNHHFKHEIPDSYIAESKFKIKPKMICSSKLSFNKKINSNLLYSNKERNYVHVDSNVKSSKLDSNIRYSTIVKNQDFRMDEYKNLSINADKIIEITVKHSKYAFQKYIINGETLTLTEFYKLQRNLALLSSLQKSKNSVYSLNRMKLIDSLGKVTPLLEQDEFNEEKPQQLCTFTSSNDDVLSESFNYEINNIKETVVDLKKQVDLKLDQDNIATEKIIKYSSFLDTTNKEKYLLSGNSENIDASSFPRDSEMHRRGKIMKLFLNTLNNNDKNWIETYHLNNLKSEPERNSFPSSITNNFKDIKKYNLQNTPEVEGFSQVYSQERFYINRWINKLQNKFKDSRCSHCSLNVLVSPEHYKILEKLSQEFDIIIFDEFVSNIISNATLYSNFANALFFDYEYFVNYFYSSLNSFKIYYILIMLLFVCIYVHSLYSETRPSINFALHKTYKYYKWILLILLSSFFWHGYNMYQRKIAEKHSVMSRVVPSYCESILVQESGVLAHFKELFRHWWHDEDCKKYYEAVMVDPSSEITFFTIITDLLAHAIFQMLQPIAHNMNSFFKVLTYDLSFFQRISIIIFTFLLLIFILYFCFSFLAFRCNYKVNFPFHLGSVEPTQFSIGSRVEEVVEKECSLKNFDICCSDSLHNHNIKNKNKNYIESIILEEKTFKSKPKNFKSKYCNLKVYRTRRSSI